MSDRNKAVSILKKAQAVIFDRLCEYVVDNEEGYLESVESADLGLHNEIYDLADKLRDLNIILASLPEPQMELNADPSKVQVVQSEGSGVTITQTAPLMTYGSFQSSVEAGNFSTAAAILGHLFQLSVGRAEDCTRFYADKLGTDPDAYYKSLTVPDAVRVHNDESLRLLHELFGLQGMEIAHVFRATQQTFGPA